MELICAQTTGLVLNPYNSKNMAGMDTKDVLSDLEMKCALGRRKCLKVALSSLGTKDFVIVTRKIFESRNLTFLVLIRAKPAISMKRSA